MFPHLKIALGGQRFSSNEEAITFVNNYFAEKNAEYYLDGLQRWKHHWDKCVELQGDYAEKKKKKKKASLLRFDNNGSLSQSEHM